MKIIHCIFLLFLLSLLFAYSSVADTKHILVGADSNSPVLISNICDAVVSSKAPLFTALRHAGSFEGMKRYYGIQGEPADKGVWNHQALNHLVIIGVPEEGKAAARTQGFTYGIDVEKKEMNRIGVGHFRGDIGTVETLFNPYLYSNRFDDNPFSTLLVRISGTTEKGVALAAKAFLRGMINGVVLGEGVERVESTILDQNPTTKAPPKIPVTLSHGDESFQVAGWSQCPENEYRAYLDYGAERKPLHVWRVKYFSKGCLDDVSGTAWVNGPHIMAWGNAVTISEFSDSKDAVRAFKGLRESGRWEPGKA
ncbi:MAG: hypothetical protein GX804_02645, partial [Lentisphaerae bacterium]|nr:hypothetical protein [Lentisphaerota bacterium]